MSYNDNLIFLKEVIDYIKNKELNKSVIEKVLEELIPDKMIGYSINEIGFNICFIPTIKKIVVSLNMIDTYLRINNKDLSLMYNIKDTKNFSIFLILFMLIHEIEHSKQYLIGKDIIDSNDILKYGYKYLYEILDSKESIIPNPFKKTKNLISQIIYRKNENHYVLERNANVESLSLLCDLALFINNEEIYNALNSMRNSFLKFGYENSNVGCFEETYRNLLMYNKYKKIYTDLDISIEDKIRYGFRIDEDTREKVLSLK